MELLKGDLLSAVNEYLSERVGLYFSDLRFSDLARGLQNAAAELEYAHSDNCIRDLLSNCFSRTQMQILVRNLTVGETYFFRDPDVFLVLEEKILPELVKTKRGQKNLRIWSAGCSTGEEPYSIAISLLRSIKDMQRWEIKLLATDINTKSLDKASRAKYGSWSFRATPEDFVSLYFDADNTDGLYTLKESLKKTVSFDYLNLAEDAFPSINGDTNDMDIIFCRNVLIYFTPRKCKEIADKLSACLRPGGILVTSANDSTRFIASAPNGMSRMNSTMYKKTSE